MAVYKGARTLPPEDLRILRKKSREIISSIYKEHLIDLSKLLNKFVNEVYYYSDDFKEALLYFISKGVDRGYFTIAIHTDGIFYETNIKYNGYSRNYENRVLPKDYMPDWLQEYAIVNKLLSLFEDMYYIAYESSVFPNVILQITPRSILNKFYDKLTAIVPVDIPFSVLEEVARVYANNIGISYNIVKCTKEIKSDRIIYTCYVDNKVLFELTVEK